MATKLISKVFMTPKMVTGKPPRIRKWRVYTCRFTSKPTAAEMADKKNLFKAFMKAVLIKRPRGKKFSLSIRWTKDATPLVYIVTVSIFQTITPPPGPVIPTPLPPPQAPPAM